MHVFYNNEEPTRAKVQFMQHIGEPPAEAFDAYDGYIEIEGGLPMPERQLGKTSTLYCNPQTEEVWYEYEDDPESPAAQIQALQDENTLLGQQIVMLELRLLQLEGSGAE